MSSSLSSAESTSTNPWSTARSVMTVCQQCPRVFGRDRGLRDDRLVRVARPREFRVAAPLRCSRSRIVMTVVYAGGSASFACTSRGIQRRIGRPQHAQYLLFQLAERSATGVVVFPFRNHYLHSMTVVVDDATTA